MKKIPLPILLFGLMFLAGYAGFFAFQFMHDPKPDQQETGSMVGTDMLMIGLPRPDFELNDIDGNPHKLSEWDGKVIILNFWATWCPPCKKELPAFVDLQTQYADQGVQFVGIAVDTPDNVRSFMQEISLNFPTLISETEAMKIASLYGNSLGALPYTVFINKSGKISYTHTGELDKTEAEKILSSLTN
ncbi:MAG: peroxiredoxin family protein [Gammaproteobacteria bacterium]